ncbi:MAG: GntR family transcriptional regulator [Eubacterium sp.]|nr:GntR family transcriptional regulator [Eubacterium sp.]
MEHDHLADGMNEYLPLRDVVFKTLRRAIVTGEFAPGERLMEITLANRLGVSRTPVREAIRKLELEGLVTMIPRKGAQVARITERSLREVIEVRSVLEEFAASLACQRMDENDMREMKEIHEQFIRAVKAHDIMKIVDSDEKFHDAIFKAAKNDRLLSIIANLREQFYRYRLEYVRDIEDCSQLTGEHQQLMSAIFRHDEETARRMMKTHIGNQQERVLEQLSDQPVGEDI